MSKLEKEGCRTVRRGIPTARGVARRTAMSCCPWCCPSRGHALLPIVSPIARPCAAARGVACRAAVRCSRGVTRRAAMRCCLSCHLSRRCMLLPVVLSVCRTAVCCCPSCHPSFHCTPLPVRAASPCAAAHCNHLSCCGALLVTAKIRVLLWRAVTKSG